MDETYYPQLKPLDQAVVACHPVLGEFYHYEPGNGTRYEVILTRRIARDPDYYPRVVVSIVNFGRGRSMVIPMGVPLDKHNISYMREKMGILEGDAWALIPLINRFMEGIK